MARVAVEQQAKRKGKTYDATLLAPGTLVLHWLSPEERKQLSTGYGGSSAVPLWSCPCRILRKSEKHQDTYIVQPIWEETKAKAYHRERLIPIPRKWGAEELQSALMELIADLRRPPKRRARRSAPLSMDGIPQHLRQQTTARLQEVQNALQDLPATTASASDSSVVDLPGLGSEDLEAQCPQVKHWALVDEPRGHKRQRHVMCFSWKDIDAAFQIAKKEVIYQSLANADQPAASST